MSECCEYCGVTGNDHVSGCPNCKTPFSAYKCELCGEGIYDGEKYIPLTGLSISGNIYEAIKTVKFSKEEYSGRKLKGPKYMILRNIDIH